MIDRLKKIEERYFEIEQLLATPEIAVDHTRTIELSKEQKGLEDIVQKFREYTRVLKDIESDNQIIKESSDAELCEMAKEELAELEESKDRLEDELKLLLVPQDPQDEKSAVMEIRAGTGGDEAGLFVGDLFRMYFKYAERMDWKIEILSSNSQGIGGFKEIIFLVNGDRVYGKLKYEAGVHRVQRVPVTEASGRIHTSAASVAVLPEAKEVDVKIDPNDLRIDVFRSSGPGGQSVNTTDSAVRITHVPTGIVVSCQDEKSQHKNKAKAMKVLRARIYEKVLEEERAKVTADRRSMVSTGDRSAKIRTFNYPQNRVTDHRIGLTLYKLDEIADGNLDELIEQLQITDKIAKLKTLD
jgi:peptide chain release factor 1